MNNQYILTGGDIEMEGGAVEEENVRLLGNDASSH